MKIGVMVEWAAIGGLCLLTACTPEFHGGPFSDQSTNVSPRRRELPQSYQLTDVEIGLKRTVCFGFCPAYEVKIFGDGRVVYNGESFVRVEGEQQAVIDKSEVLTLLQRLYEIHFFDMQDEYQIAPGVFEQNGLVTESQGMVTDLPSQMVSVRIGAYEKTVHHYIGGPTDLKALIEFIDEVAGTQRWIK